MFIGALIFSLSLPAQAATITIDGAQKFQTIDGFGVNANSLSWDNGELKPAIDLLADDMGSNQWRVVFDMEDWESVNDNSDPNVFNWNYYNSLYANAKFQNLWGTLGYLNQKGISSGIALSFMGRVPNWMSGSGTGSNISVNFEDEWVEMMASLVYYARNTSHVSFALLDPINEPDWDGYEGPQVSSAQYARLLNKLSQKLDSLGLNDIKFLGPNTASVDVGVNTYMPQMMLDSIVMSKVDHFGFHNYEGYTGNAAQAIKNSAYPNRNFYMTEITTPADVLAVINQGPSAIHIWEGYDSVYNHAILAGRGSTPPNDAGNGLAPLAYDVTTGQYSPRKIFYQHKQLFKYVPSGAVRIAASQSNMSAFFHQTSGRVTLVGTNTSSGTISYTGTLLNLPAMSALEFYWTSATDPTKNFFKEANLNVTNGAFSFNAPANSTFTLTGLVTSADQTPPAVSISVPTEGETVSGTTTLSAVASDVGGVAGVRFLLDGANLGGEILSPPYNLSWDTTTVTNGSYRISAVARDIGGNTTTSSPINIIVFNSDPVAPTVSITSPSAGSTVAGTIAITASATDNIGVAGVQLLLDGNPFKTEITATPYSAQLDTTTLNDGLHSVSARARDTSGNTTTSQPVSFTVINKPGTSSPINLVQKASNITSSSQNLTTALPSNVTAGNLIVVSVSGWPNLPASTAVTDNQGNTYSIAGTVLVSQGAYSAIY
ncbi:MAG: Ig-like domain-containing protein, partial [Flavisolibacter sp.]